MPKAGADAARDPEVSDAINQIVRTDPDIQAAIKRVWGGVPLDQRPSDTPKHLEKANERLKNEINSLLAAKGIKLPDRTFINGRSESVEGHRGWSGLNGWQKAAIIAAAAATGVGAAALTAGGGAAAAGAAGGAATGSGAGAGTAAGLGAGIGVTSGVPAGLGAATATGIGAGGAAVGGGSGLTGILANAGINAAKTKLTGGSWKDALVNAGVGAATGGVGGAAGAAANGGKMSWTSLLANYGKDLAKDPNTYKAIAGSLAQGMEKGRGQENLAAQSAAQHQVGQQAAREAALINRAGLDLRQRDFAQGSQNNAYKNALLSAIAMNMQDVSASRPKGVPTISFSGGARPSVLGAEGRAAAGVMNKKAMESLLAGEQFEKLPDFEGVAAPEFKKPGFWENALGTAGMVTGQIAAQQDAQRGQEFQHRLLQQIEKLSQPQQPTTPTRMPVPIGNSGVVY